MDALSAGKKEAGAAVSTTMKEGESYAIEGNAGAQGAGYPTVAGGNMPAGDSPIVKPNTQGNSQGDGSFLEAARKYKV